MKRMGFSAVCLLDSPELVAASARMMPMAISGIYRVRLGMEPWELKGYNRLRRQVFCQEQRLFTGTDQDEQDCACVPIVAVSSAVVSDDDIIGGVRIYEESPGVWFGSRLAVDPDWRGVAGLAPSLIRAAVSTARSRGCHTFLATVQRQNVPLFRRLGWRTLGDVNRFGVMHQLMQAGESDGIFSSTGDSKPTV